MSERDLIILSGVKMLQTWVSLFSFVTVILLLLALLRSWLGKSWFFSWLKGSIGFICLALILSIGLMVLDLWSYKAALSEKPLAQVDIEQLDTQYFLLKLTPTAGDSKTFPILGDQWQMDVRLLTWKGPFLSLGVSPLYRFDRLSGRYASIEHERLKQRSVYELEHSHVLDIWDLSQKFNVWLHANYGTSVFMPLADQAQYSILLNARGLVVKPANKQAQVALKGGW